MPPEDREAEEVRDAQEGRAQNPSAWFEFTRSPSVTLLADALLDAPPHREFTRNELAARADVSDQSVLNHEDTLERFGLIESVQAAPARFRVRSDSETMQALTRLDAVLDYARYRSDNPVSDGPEPTPPLVEQFSASLAESPSSEPVDVAVGERGRIKTVQEKVKRELLMGGPTP